MAIVELPSERMVDQFEPCLFFIALEGSVEEQLKPSSRRIVHCILQMTETCREVEKWRLGDKKDDGRVEDLKLEETTRRTTGAP